MPIFKAKRNVMSPQIGHNGKPKLDINGEPLRSVQIVQDVKQRHQMAKLMKDFQHAIYTPNTTDYPIGKHQIGIDPVAYDCDTISRDILDKMSDWESYSAVNHIFESFVIRHNWMLDQMIVAIDSWQEIPRTVRDNEIQRLEEKFRITIPKPAAQRYFESLEQSEVFETAWKK